jgi:hypothetical protein
MISQADQLKAMHFAVPEDLIDGLDIGVLAGALNVKNVTSKVSGKKLTMAANDKNYVYVDLTDLTIKSNVTGFPSDALRLWEIDTDATDVTIKTDVRSIMRSSMHTDHVSLVVEDQSHNADAWKVVGRVVMDGSRYTSGTCSQILCMVKQTGGGTGYVRLYNYSEAEELAQIEVTEAVWTAKQADLSGCPSSTIAILEVQIKTNGTGVINCGAAVLEIM